MGLALLPLTLLASSSADNLDPRRYQPQRLARAVQSAQSGNRASVQQAEAMLSTAFVQYIRASGLFMSIRSFVRHLRRPKASSIRPPRRDRCPAMFRTWAG